MRFKTMLISMAWVSTALAGELPPELPFQAIDGTSLSPYQEGVAGDLAVKDTHQVPNSKPHEMDGQVVNGISEAHLRDQNQSTKEPAIQLAQPEPSEPEPKPKKRPKTLGRVPETKKASTKNKAIDLGLQSGITIKPKPGRTESIVIAKGKLNRIVTPYAEPKVLTVDNVETKIDGSAVYIATDSDTPVSLFISDTETGSAASLQLAPQELVVPVEIRLEADPAMASASEAASSKTDRLFRQDSPYITDVKVIMQNLGKQQIPQGFTLEEVTDELRSITLCHDAALTFRPGQLLSGHDSRIVVVIAKNNGTSTAVFEEAFCTGENTLAVAAWPKVRLEPGEKTEVFILMRLPEGKSGEEIRPALLY
jgi:conjugal transfer pilus assembly protein TraK